MPSTRARAVIALGLAVKPVGKPDAGNPHVRFDERGRETGCCRMAQATAPVLDSTINNSCGTVVDLDALAAALRDGHLRGAAVDVFPVEPASNAEAFRSPLQGLDNVILTPHVGGSTEEAQERIGAEVARKLVDLSDVGSTVGAVNFPQVQLPQRASGARFIQVQRNLPGMLGRLNEVFAKRKV